MARFNLKDYEMVEDRLKRFWKECPNGAVRTEVEWVSEDGMMVAFSSSLYRDKDDADPTATGTAMDWKGKTRGAEATNWWETAETSAIGRAIANSPWQNPKAKRPSRQEMAIAEGRQGGASPPKPKAKPKVAGSTLKRLHILLGEVEALNPALDKAEMYRQWEITSSKEFTPAQVKEAISQLEGVKEALEGNRELAANRENEANTGPTLKAEDLPPVEGELKHTLKVDWEAAGDKVRSPDAAPTDKQLALVAKVVEEKNIDLPGTLETAGVESVDDLNRGQISALIDALFSA